MKKIRRSALFTCLGVSLLILAGCQAAGDRADFEYLPIFGDGTSDNSPVVATVNGVAITQRDMDYHLEELKLAKFKTKKYEGPEGQRLLLKEMVDQVILVQKAVGTQIYNEPSVARSLVSGRRTTLAMAMKEVGILKGQEPTQEDLQDFYMANRDKYNKEGIVQARHVECRTKEDAERAYELLRKGGWENRFPVVLKDFSVNAVTASNEGNLGWFNEGGYIPSIEDPKTFTTLVFDFPNGINPPIQVGRSWHVVEILDREYARGMTFGEARRQVLIDMNQEFQSNLIKDYLMEARKSSEVVFHGVFAPGQGLTADELFARAQAVADPNQKLDLFKMIYTDFPESDRADDALFLSGNLALDVLMERREGAGYLSRLLKEYPDSELVPDTQFLLENLNNPKAMNPTSIEDLRQ